MSAILHIQHLSKKYGDRLAVNDLSMSVNEGDIFGFVGPNGAGKTSTIRMIATLLAPDTGEIFVDGHSSQRDPVAVRSTIGYMPDFFGVYQNTKVWEYLDFFAGCFKIPQDQCPGLINNLLELVELSHRREDMVESLSRGMKQRLSLARTLLHDPQVLILDEPASGLDPRARVEIRELLVELSRMGKTVFFSTHILADVAEICTRIGIIEAGSLIAAGPLDTLSQNLVSQRRICIKIIDDPHLAITVLGRQPGIIDVRALEQEVNSGLHRVKFWFQGNDDELSNLLAVLVQEKIRVVQFTEETEDLEDVFLRVTNGLVT
jgi:ABC-2 type transport system ATP-binding protein